MATVLLTKRIEFAASHRYHNPRWDAGRNRAVFGACNNPHGHGHNYLLEVTIGGDVDPVTGMVVNLYDLKQVLEEVLVAFDHKHLNLDTPYFTALIPTTENIARVLWRLLSQHPEIGELTKIALYEDEDLSAAITPADMQAEPGSALVSRRYRFSSGHDLRAADVSGPARASLYGTCHSGDGHGHDYTLEVAVGGMIDADTGMVTDLAALDGIVTDQVVRRFDGRQLADGPLMGGGPPTGERLARAIWRTLAPAIPKGRLHRVALMDGQGRAFECREEAQARSR
jgi:6-pyruvoyltetrahydropterin/6-carboxytetrahydropterin synthase